MRRAKGRARHIASFARKKGTSVLLGSRGISLDKVFYPIDKPDTIPSIYIPPNTLTIPKPLSRSTTTASNTQVSGAINNTQLPSSVNNTLVPVESNDGIKSIQTLCSHEPSSVWPTEQAALPLPTWQNRPTKLYTDQSTGLPRRHSPLIPSHQMSQSQQSLTKGIDHLQQGPPIPNSQPKSARPKTVSLEKMKETKAGLVYSGLTARFSHLYKVEIIIDNKPFNSVEQKLQYEKAILARKFKLAADIMDENDTHRIKVMGDKIPLTKEWMDMRLLLSAHANEAIFNQHKFLMEALLSTGEKRLIKGTTSAFWGAQRPSYVQL